MCGGEGGETKLVVALTFVPDPDPKRDPVTARPEAENVRRHHISSISTDPTVKYS